MGSRVRVSYTPQTVAMKVATVLFFALLFQSRLLSYTVAGNSENTRKAFLLFVSALKKCCMRIAGKFFAHRRKIVCAQRKNFGNDILWSQTQ